MERKRHNNADAVEIPSGKEQQAQHASTAQRMGAEAYSASIVASYIEAQKDAPNISLEEIAQMLQKVRAINKYVNEKLGESEKAENIYDQNRRTSRHPGPVVITNAAIA